MKVSKFNIKAKDKSQYTKGDGNWTQHHMFVGPHKLKWTHFKGDKLHLYKIINHLALVLNENSQILTCLKFKWHEFSFKENKRSIYNHHHHVMPYMKQDLRA